MPNGRQGFRTLPLVTIAMVTYNSGRFLREAMQSALAQDCDDFELLVCDDCSHDDSWGIVKSFDDRRIRAVRNDVNLGEYLNRNKALGLARGKYIMFLDGDDIIYPHGLRQLVRVMEQFRALRLRAAWSPRRNSSIPSSSIRGNSACAPFSDPAASPTDFTQLFFRTEALRAIGGFDGRYRSGDTQIQLKLGLRSHVVLMGGGLAWWRKRRGQASEAIRSNGEAVKERWQYGVDTLNDPACPLTPREKTDARHNLSRLVLRHALRLASRGRFHDALRIALTTGIRAAEWRSLLRGYQFPYLRDVTGDNPIRERIDVPMPAPMITRKSWGPRSCGCRSACPRGAQRWSWRLLRSESASRARSSISAESRG
jgi:glycosyltransferase involved in cell wall biosynthesis